MKQHLILLFSLHSALAFSPSFTCRNDVSLHARRGKGLDVPSGAAKGIGGNDGSGKYIFANDYRFITSP